MSKKSQITMVKILATATMMNMVTNKKKITPHICRVRAVAGLRQALKLRQALMRKKSLK